MSYEKPLPAITAENAPYYDSLRQHAMRLQRCGSCAVFRYPASPHCPRCLSEAFEWTPVSGRGAVYSWIVMHQIYDPAFRPEAPYNVAVVELAEGPRLTTNLVDCPSDAIRIGMPVAVVYDDVTDEVTLAKFRPAS
jgi:uncharacterized OB-fold protein